MSNNSDAISPDFYYPQYKAAVYDNLITGVVYGKEQKTRCYLSILSYNVLGMVTGIYIVAYVTSAYILLWVMFSMEGCTRLQ